MNEERNVLNAALREDLATFVHRAFQTIEPGKPFRRNWHLEVIAWNLERVLSGDIRRLIITLPPRSLKSICASVAFPAWALGRNPTLRIIGASYSADLAGKHARDCRQIMDAGWYAKVFPGTQIDPAKNTEAEFVTTGGGFRLSTSTGGTLTGRGGNLLIVDDPTKAADALSDVKREGDIEWFRSTLYSRLDDKANDRIVVIMQRLHVDDLVGHLLASGEAWTHLNLPAIAEEPERFDLGDGRVFTRASGEALHPERESLEVLERTRLALGTFAFSANYQQQPIPIGGNLIKSKWFRTYAAPLEPLVDDCIVQSWDTASKGDEVHDFSVCTTWRLRGDDNYLVEVFRMRLDYPGLKKAVIEQARRHAADTVLIEDAGAGQALVQEFQDDGPVRPIPIAPVGDKVTRLFRATNKIGQGYVYLPTDADSLPEFQRELLAFPRTSHDDQVDSLSQFLNWEGLSARREAAMIGEHLERCLELMAEGSAERAFNDPAAPWNLDGIDPTL